MKAHKIGTVNGFVGSVFKMGRKKLTFDGTTTSLVAVAVANGAVDGTTLKCNYGGKEYKWCDITMVVGTEASGRIWASRQWGKA